MFGALTRRLLPRHIAWAAAFALCVLAGCRREAAPGRARLAFDAEIPAQVPPGTHLRLGDPTVQKQLALMGDGGTLPFQAEWQNISGGPNTIEAFRADVLDGGSVGDTPPIHATFTGLKVKIIAVQVRDKPIYQLAFAPGTSLRSIRDLRGKKIGFSAGQAQGALVLRVLKAAGIGQQEVQLVRLQSPEFKDALASRQVDVAPLSGTGLLRYLNEYRERGAGAITHGVRDSLAFFYVRSDVLEDPAKAAALREYVKTRTRAQLWAARSPDAWIREYYVKDQGLSREEGAYLVDAAGVPRYPSDWSEIIRDTQETIDLLSIETGQKSFDASSIFDRRFEPVAAAVARTGA